MKSESISYSSYIHLEVSLEETQW